jgi:transcription elongation GreA/GreB family factor
MAGKIDKRALLAALREELQAELARSTQRALDAAEAATHEENRAEGDKDMRSTEQSYLARGQAMRAEDLAEQLQRLRAEKVVAFGAGDAIAVGALVLVEVDAAARRALYVSPYGAGAVLRVGNVEVTVVTPSSPMGQALLGKQAGDDFELRTRGVERSYVIAGVA